jgi:hypothetical protein
MADGRMEDMRELLNEMRQILKSGHHKQALAKMDETISFGECDPIVRLMFQFTLGRTPVQHRTEARRLRAESPELHEVTEFHELFADMLE